MQKIELRYDPWTSKGTDISENEFNNYYHQRGLVEIVKKVVIEPITTKLKEESEKDMKFGSLTLTKKTSGGGSSTAWKPALEGLEAFLDIRADDARAASMEDVTYVDGVGYCMDVQAWTDQITKQIRENTTPKAPSISIEWPKPKGKQAALRRIEIPINRLRSLTEESVRLAMEATRFSKSLEEELIDPFKEAVKSWHQKETGYNNKEKLPSKEDRIIDRARSIALGKTIYVQLVRVDDIEYKSIVSSLDAEQRELSEGKSVTGYRLTFVKGHPFVNIKTVKDRAMKLKEEATNPTARYEIVP